MDFNEDEESARLSVEIVQNGDEWSVAASVRAYSAAEVCEMVGLLAAEVNRIHGEAHIAAKLDGMKN